MLSHVSGIIISSETIFDIPPDLAVTNCIRSPFVLMIHPDGVRPDCFCARKNRSAGSQVLGTSTGRTFFLLGEPLTRYHLTSGSDLSSADVPSCNWPCVILNNKEVMMSQHRKIKLCLLLSDGGNCLWRSGQSCFFTLHSHRSCDENALFSLMHSCYCSYTEAAA